MLKEHFIFLINNYSNDTNLIAQLWNEIEKNYSNKNRHYHTLSHLENLLIQLSEVKKEIKNWDTILFSLFYHDAVYNVLKSNNEEKSAELAEKRMKQISVPLQLIEECKSQIIATKKHNFDSNNDTNYFTDADLSVLGQSWEVYSEYFKNVRKEYRFYPNLIYNSGRKKVLNHFLNMDRIFKTEYFYYKFELQAKENLQRELEIL
jgi:predicted metal-dependent HD superfamily phosphohydrolase